MSGGSILVIVLLVCGVLALIVKLFERKFTCRCGKNLKILGIDSCPDCLRYYKKEKETIRELGPGDVENSPVFAIRRNRIPNFPDRWIWPERCSVCGAPAQRYDNLIVTHRFFNGKDVEGKNFTVKIPHCRAHSAGVSFGNASNLNATDLDKTSILFSSYDYWQMFIRANGVRRPE